MPRRSVSLSPPSTTPQRRPTSARSPFIPGAARRTNSIRNGPTPLPGLASRFSMPKAATTPRPPLIPPSSARPGMRWTRPRRYVRIMRLCQPESILEWQLTQDYSVLTSDAGGALQPAQRFHNLKQFNLAPAGSAWIPAQSSSGLVLPAACVDPSRRIYTVHLVNNGAGLPGHPRRIARPGRANERVCDRWEARPGTARAGRRQEWLGPIHPAGPNSDHAGQRP